MTVFVDTNVFIDFLFKRDGYDEALLILKAIKLHILEGYVADISLLNIDYVAQKHTVDTQAFLKIIARDFVIVGADNDLFYRAFSIANNDLEDTIQYLLAHQRSVDCIITNDRTFYRGAIPLLSSREFVERYL
jgi:predicted nucleic acid-binding protein